MKTRLVAIIVFTVSVGYAQQIPQLLNYQGRVAVSGVNFDGTGLFKFALVSGDGSVTYWSNDGTSSNGNEPSGAAAFPVTKGLYCVLLGDTSVGSMTSIPLSVFTNSDVRLRVWFDDGVHGSELLSPDQRIASSGYAMLAATVADGAITSSKIGAGAVTQSNLAQDAVGAAQIAPGAVDFTRLAVSGTAQSGQVLGFDGNGFAWTTPGPGGGGLSSVSHNTTLIGNGTSGSPLGLTIPLAYNTSSSSPLWYVTNSGSGTGVRGDSVSGIGVLGSSTNSFGVGGSSTNSVGVEGVSANSYGVYGSSSSSGFAGVYGINTAGGYGGYFNGDLYSSGNFVLDAGTSPRIYTAANGGEQNRYLTLLNSPSSPSSSGLKAGGVLVSDDYLFANPAKNNLVVKGAIGIGTFLPASTLDVRGNLVLDPGTSPRIYTAASGFEQNRYLTLLNSLTTPSASGLKAGGILVSDDYAFANPAKDTLIVKGSVSIGTAATNNGYRLFVRTTDPFDYGIFGFSDSGQGVVGGSTTNIGVNGNSTSGVGVSGTSTSSNGVVGNSNSGTGVLGISHSGPGLVAQSDSDYGVRATSTSGTAVSGHSTNAKGVYGYSFFNVGVFGECAVVPGAYAGWFEGRVRVNGVFEKSAGSFKIDHPLDPANKYLSHSFVESPDMKNIYDGNVVTDANGDATVTMPDWFEPLNRGFRYQLTVIGQFAQAIVSSEIKDNSFRIKTDKPNVKVSWQVTGVRHDAFANAHRIQVEEDKPEKERGYYLFPAGFGQPVDKGIAALHDPKRPRQKQPNK